MSSTGNLDSFVKSSKPPPAPTATSQEIRDRASLFVGTIFPASTPEDARRAVNHLKHVVHRARPATHEIAAWRCMVLKPGKSGLGGPDDFEVVSGADDDGETHAGGRVLKVIQAESVIDAVVVVSRWYGGEMLGPVRFEHIETCAREVCRTFRLKDDMVTCVATLTSLDDILASLRAELASVTARKTSSEPTSSQSAAKRSTAKPYATLEESLDIAKAKRLITARENSIKSVKQALKKAREREPEQG
ncbi:ribosomal protein S5 domain 2-like protein [Dichomitus squalens LYAD-421 SS1]|uniref:Ribosomal protein S5 domain 2-like protein n=1 Tax=Dichomitus squalens (strain LYAD-421) TaxID=732165 RepID=R7SM58_DICSQ|nr:ribosomal protein S5 domain 2-like protein [Dichomitus squalens LYAD-421 SS1]EJF56820.1 ribosomal protein S5 domain 2-like protein [Dichomitus squalens LYAD-421 SS1]